MVAPTRKICKPSDELSKVMGHGTWFIISSTGVFGLGGGRRELWEWEGGGLRDELPTGIARVYMGGMGMGHGYGMHGHLGEACGLGWSGWACITHLQSA